MLKSQTTVYMVAPHRVKCYLRY